jgi:hypothetical protein
MGKLGSRLTNQGYGAASSCDSLGPISPQAALSRGSVLDPMLKGLLSWPVVACPHGVPLSEIFLANHVHSFISFAFPRIWACIFTTIQSTSRQIIVKVTRPGTDSQQPASGGPSALCLEFPPLLSPSGIIKHVRRTSLGLQGSSLLSLINPLLKRKPVTRNVTHHHVSIVNKRFSCKSPHGLRAFANIKHAASHIPNR